MSKEDIQEFFQIGETRAANLKNELKALLKIYSGDEAKIVSAADSLIAKYNEKHRAYHNLSHLHFLLQNAERFKDKIADFESVRLAVWFHDAIYDPQSRTNEAESAALAVERLTEINYPKAKIERVEKMILATEKHDASALDADARSFLDWDLGILGAPAEIYKKYAQAIRLEYGFVPEDLYRQKRREVLQSFLQRKYIYYTEEMRGLYEEAARRNIENEIKELS
jgi:predicted metal-dependent HD superfamily phosphohydrolase